MNCLSWAMPREMRERTVPRGDLEDVRDFLIGRVVHVEEGQRRAKGFLDLRKVLDGLNAIE